MPSPLQTLLADPRFSGMTQESINLLHALQQLRMESDRSVAVLAGAYIDDLLTIAIKANLIDDDKNFNEMFDVGKPAGDFSAKARLAYLLGLFDKTIYDELRDIAKIRNDFAHKIKFDSFGHENMRGRIMSLRLLRSTAVIDGVVPKNRSYLTDRTPMRFTQVEFDELISDPREVFFNTALIMIGVLMAAKNRAKRPEVVMGTPSPL